MLSVRQTGQLGVPLTWPCTLTAILGRWMRGCLCWVPRTRCPVLLQLNTRSSCALSSARLLLRRRLCLRYRLLSVLWLQGCCAVLGCRQRRGVINLHGCCRVSCRAPDMWPAAAGQVGCVDPGQHLGTVVGSISIVASCHLRLRSERCICGLRSCFCKVERQLLRWRGSRGCLPCLRLLRRSVENRRRFRAGGGLCREPRVCPAALLRLPGPVPSLGWPHCPAFRSRHPSLRHASANSEYPQHKCPGLLVSVTDQHAQHSAIIFDTLLAVRALTAVYWQWAAPGERLYRQLSNTCEGNLICQNIALRFHTWEVDIVVAGGCCRPWQHSSVLDHLWPAPVRPPQHCHCRQVAVGASCRRPGTAGSLGRCACTRPHSDSQPTKGPSTPWAIHAIKNPWSSRLQRP